MFPHSARCVYVSDNVMRISLLRSSFHRPDGDTHKDSVEHSLNQQPWSCGRRHDRHPNLSFYSRSSATPDENRCSDRFARIDIHREKFGLICYKRSDTGARYGVTVSLFTLLSPIPTRDLADSEAKEPHRIYLYSKVQSSQNVGYLNSLEPQS